MKKTVLSLVALVASVGASAGIFDPAYRVGKDKVATTINVAGGSASSYEALNATVGITDRFSVIVDSNNTGTTPDPFVGVDYNVIGGTGFSLDVIGGWGIGLSGGHDASDNDDKGTPHSIQAGVKARGVSGKFSYNAIGAVDYTFATEWDPDSEEGSHVGFGLSAEAAYALTPKFGIKGGIAYGFDGERDDKSAGTKNTVKSQARTDLELGTVYSGETFSVNPYVQWNYGEAYDGDWYDGWAPNWTYGVRIGTEI
ncbi:MAG: hypothetical protein LBT92_01740 [Rickettsiales bacterium]|jgi:hypothetical protein|nr:hypothetical protein [Rickettsiales bacterium]